MSFYYYYNYLFLTTFITNSGDIIFLNYSYSYCKEANSPYNYIIIKSSLHYIYYIYLDWDCNIKKIFSIKLKKIQQMCVYLDNKLLSIKTLINFIVMDI